MIAIINYGVGNLTSVLNMFNRIGADAMITADAEEIKKADRLLLPGVGHFDSCMQRFNESGLRTIVELKVFTEKVPLLGICVGAQTMTRGSEEGIEKGLGWVNAETVAFDTSKMESGLKVPHMGWNYVKSFKDCDLFKDMHPDPRFYFVHSYHFKMKNPEDIWLQMEYGYEFCAAFQKDNIYACQFHPEKSHKFGLRLMENFVNL